MFLYHSLTILNQWWHNTGCVVRNRKTWLVNTSATTHNCICPAVKDRLADFVKAYTHVVVTDTCSFIMLNKTLTSVIWPISCYLHKPQSTLFIHLRDAAFQSSSETKHSHLLKDRSNKAGLYIGLRHLRRIGSHDCVMLYYPIQCDCSLIVRLLLSLGCVSRGGGEATTWWNVYFIDCLPNAFIRYISNFFDKTMPLWRIRSQYTVQLNN